MPLPALSTMGSAGSGLRASFVDAQAVVQPVTSMQVEPATFRLAWVNVPEVSMVGKAYS